MNEVIVILVLFLDLKVQLLEVKRNFTLFPDTLQQVLH